MSLLRRAAFAVATALVLQLVTCQTPEPLECAASGYCSLGQSKFWTGDIAKSAALRQMLESVSFKKELIFTSVAWNDKRPDRLWMDQLLQMRYELHRMGLGHFFVLTLYKEECDAIHKFASDVSCVWNSMESQETANGIRLVWVSRWRMMTRALRLGYNLMSVDVDFMFLRDPYLHLKRPPLDQHKMFCLREGYGPLMCNGGFMYIQNALPNGPISWVLRMVAENNAWMADDNWNYIQEQGGNKYCATDDQAMLRDAITSAVVGRPLHPTSFEGCKPTFNSKARDGVTLHRGTVIPGISWLVSESSRAHQVIMEPPKDWMQPSINLDTLQDCSNTAVNMTVPNLAYGWPEELGGRMGPEERGPYTRAWHDMLKEDCPTCPWWDDNRPIPPGKEEANLHRVLGPAWNGGGLWDKDMFVDPNIPQESMVFAPWWLVASLASARRGAVVGYNAPVPSAPVMVHVHVWSEMGHPAHKLQLRKIVGRYHWGIGDHMGKSFGRHGPYLSHHPVQQVVALHPSIDLSRTRDAGEFNAIVSSLLQVAMLTKRHAVLPDLPCNTMWALGDLNRYGHEFIRFKHNTCPTPNSNPSLMRFSMQDQWPQAMPFILDEDGGPLGAWRGEQNANGGNTPGGRRVSQLPLPGMEHQPHPGRGQEGPQGNEGGAEWWDSRRYKFQMPYAWDEACTGVLRAILSSELRYWFSSEPIAAAGARQEPDEQNTVFTPAPEELTLLPADDPEGKLPLLAWREKRGWSLADVQAVLPAARVISEMDRLSKEPIVYLGHPIGVLPGKEWFRRAAEQARQNQDTGVGVGGQGAGTMMLLPHNRHQHQHVAIPEVEDENEQDSPHGKAASRLSDLHQGGVNQGINYSARLHDVNERMMECNCKAVWEKPWFPGWYNHTYVLDYRTAKLAALRSHGLVEYHAHLINTMHNQQGAHRAHHSA